MPNDTQPQIFLSYSWANKDIANEIDNDFIAVGITFRRDARDIGYTKSIKEFMQSIQKSDFVVMLISDEYIRSENCMYEVMELLGAHEFEKRILPVLLNETKIYNRPEQEKYYDYWKEKMDDAKRIAAKHPHGKTIEDKKKIENIYNSLPLFFERITDIKSEKYEYLRALGYKPMLDKIGFGESQALERIFKIAEIKDVEEQELALEQILADYPNNISALFYKAYFADERKLYKKARKYYELFLAKYPTFAPAHYNFALLLELVYSEYSLARLHYEMAIRINSRYDAAYNNLAILLGRYFGDYSGAKNLYEIAIGINPEVPESYSNLANIMQMHFKDFGAAEKMYKKAISVNPNFVEAIYNLAILLETHLSDIQGAKHYYEKAIQIDPLNTVAMTNLAVLLNRGFKDYENSKLFFEKAIELDPNNLKARNNLAVLLEERFSDYKNAKLQYEKALEIDPNYELAKNNIADLVKKHFSE